MSTPSPLHIGDLVLTRDDSILLIGHFASSHGGGNVAWNAIFWPTHPDLGTPFLAPYPYDMAARDAEKPGAHLQWQQAGGCP